MWEIEIVTGRMNRIEFNCCDNVEAGLLETETQSADPAK